MTSPVQQAPSPAEVPQVRAAPSRGDIVGPKHRPAEIKEHPVADKILDALSSYQRPYLKEEKAETAGHPTASYAAGPVVPAPGMPTPAPEPRLELTNSLVQELDTRKARAAVEAAARDVPTVVTKTVARDPHSEEELFPTPIEGVPRKLVGPGSIAAIALVLLCLAGAAIVAVTRKPAPSQPVTDTQASAPARDSAAVPLIPPPEAASLASSMTAAPTTASARAPTTTPTSSAPSPDVPVTSPSKPAASSAATATAPSAFPSKSTFQVEN